jgi:serine/threonine protein kinase
MYTRTQPSRKRFTKSTHKGGSKRSGTKRSSSTKQSSSTKRSTKRSGKQSTSKRSSSTRRSSSTNEVTEIGHGSYGCVYKPPLQCNTKRQTVQPWTKMYPEDHRITKLGSKENMLVERNQSKVMDEIDPKYEFHMPTSLCEAGRAVTKYVAPKCDALTGLSMYRRTKDRYEAPPSLSLSSPSLRSKLYLIQTEFGGVGVGRLVGTAQYTKSEWADFFRSYGTLLGHIAHISKKDVLHMDLHSGNVLYDQQLRKCNLIDFGLTEHLTTHTDQERIRFARKRCEQARYHWSYPPEFGAVFGPNYEQLWNASDIRTYVNQLASAGKRDRHIWAHWQMYLKKFAYKQPMFVDEYAKTPPNLESAKRLLIAVGQGIHKMIHKSSNGNGSSATASYSTSTLFMSVYNCLNTYPLGLMMQEMANTLAHRRQFTSKQMAPLRQLGLDMSHPDITQRLMDWPTVLHRYDRWLNEMTLTH